MSEIRVTCPHCNQTLQVPEKLLGRMVRCPKCREGIQLPSPQLPSQEGSELGLARLGSEVVPDPTQPSSSLSVPTKACPFCAEQILSAARKCKHCGEFLDDTDRARKEGAGPERASGTSIARSSKSPAPKPSFWQTLAHGALRKDFQCPHCKRTGCVYTREVKVKAGISGGKITGAILTGGASLLVTGLARKDRKTEAYCDNCKVRWHF